MHPFDVGSSVVNGTKDSPEQEKQHQILIFWRKKIECVVHFASKVQNRIPQLVQTAAGPPSEEGSR